MTGQEFYIEAMKRENWPEDDLCDPPTDPRLAMHTLIDHFLGEDWYVDMPENDDQCITVATAEILNTFPKNKLTWKKIPWSYIIFTIVNVGAVIFNMLHG